MVAVFVCGIAVALGQSHPAGDTPKYDPAKHLAFIEKRMADVGKTVADIKASKIELRAAVQKLGTMLGESRKLQSSLSAYMKTVSAGSGKALRIIQVSGLFDAYLSSAILELDGDADSGELAISLEKRLKQRISASKE